MRLVTEETWEVHKILADLRLPYAIIGGAAVQIWGEPRFTKDLDFTVLAPIESFSETVKQLLAHLEPRIDNALQFAQKNRVVIDVRRVIARQKQSLDLPYIHYWLDVFAELLETDDVTDRFEQAWRKYGPES